MMERMQAPADAQRPRARIDSVRLMGFGIPNLARARWMVGYRPAHEQRPAVLHLARAQTLFPPPGKHSFPSKTPAVPRFRSVRRVPFFPHNGPRL
jgi:hypothetical protein